MVLAPCRLLAEIHNYLAGMHGRLVGDQNVQILSAWLAILQCTIGSQPTGVNIQEAVDHARKRTTHKNERKYPRVHI